MVKCSKRLDCGKRCSRTAVGGGASCCWQHGGSIIKKRKRSRSKSRGQKRVGGGMISKPSKLAKPKMGEWTIYGHQMCPYTAKAFEHFKKVVKNNGGKLVFYDLGVIKSESLNSFRIYLFDHLGNHRTMPMIFNPKGIFIGGYSNLVG